MITPELYLGYVRGNRYAGETRPALDRIASYRLPDTLPESSFAFRGRWRIEGERVVAAGRESSLLLRFRAAEVHLVLAGRGRVTVAFENRGRTIRVSRDRLYRLLNLPSVRDGVLRLRFTSGVAAYAFIFGADVAGERGSDARRGADEERRRGPVVARDRSFAPS